MFGNTQSGFGTFGATQQSGSGLFGGNATSTGNTGLFGAGGTTTGSLFGQPAASTGEYHYSTPLPDYNKVGLF